MAPIKTKSELADELGRNKSAVTRYTQRPDWPFSRTGPWLRTDLEAIRQWVIDNVLEVEAQRLVGTGDELKELRKQKIRKEIEKLEGQIACDRIDIGKKRGELLEASLVSEQWASVGVTVRNSLENLPSQIIPLALTHGIPHEAADVFRGQVEALVGGVLRHLSQQ